MILGLLSEMLCILFSHLDFSLSSYLFQNDRVLRRLCYGNCGGYI